MATGGGIWTGHQGIGGEQLGQQPVAARGRHRPAHGASRTKQSGARKIAQVRVRAFASTDYLQRRGTPQLPEDLTQHDLIAGDTNTEIQQGFEAMGYPASALRFVLRTDDMNVQWAAVRAGLGIGFMGQYHVESDPTIAALLPMKSLPGLPIWLTVHRELHTSARIRAVYEFLAEEVGKSMQKMPLI